MKIEPFIDRKKIGKLDFDCKLMQKKSFYRMSACILFPLHPGCPGRWRARDSYKRLGGIRPDGWPLSPRGRWWLCWCHSRPCWPLSLWQRWNGDPWGAQCPEHSSTSRDLSPAWTLVSTSKTGWSSGGGLLAETSVILKKLSPLMGKNKPAMKLHQWAKSTLSAKSP